jgi:hypothetical protein
MWKGVVILIPKPFEACDWYNVKMPAVGVI